MTSEGDRDVNPVRGEPVATLPSEVDDIDAARRSFMSSTRRQVTRPLSISSSLPS